MKYLRIYSRHTQEPLADLFYELEEGRCEISSRDAHFEVLEQKMLTSETRLGAGRLDLKRRGGEWPGARASEAV